jgi:acyl dehydratase
LEGDRRKISASASECHAAGFLHRRGGGASHQKASASPRSGTIAHGFLTLTLLSTLGFDAMPGVEGTRMDVNYGFERVRFLSPRQIRNARARQISFNRPDGTRRILAIRLGTVVEVEGSAKPALEAHWITLALVDPRND